MKTKVFLFLIMLLAASPLAFAGIQCAECGAMDPTSPSDHNPGCSYGPATSSSPGNNPGGHVPHAPSMKSMVTTTIAQSLINAVLSSPPKPAGPTAEQLAIQQLEEQQRQSEEQLEAQQLQLKKQQNQEFLRSKSEFVGKLKGTGPTYVEDKNIRTTDELKLKSVDPAASSSGDTHSGFFGIPGSTKPTVALLREPVINGDLITDQKQLIEERIEEPNKWCSAIQKSLKTKAPPLPYKKFNQLQPGDVLLIEADGISRIITETDKLFSGNKTSSTSHTVLFLKKVNGVKYFLENIPNEGPRIILENEFLQRYSSRGAQLARLAQPLNQKEAKQLFSAAVDMAAKNRREIVNSEFTNTNYGLGGKADVVCSEADWALLKVAGREIPKSDDKLKGILGVKFSPADFYDNEQYFLVSPLDMPQ